MEEPHRNALKPGTRLQWYRILRVLGQGGFGITYLARDTNLDIDVALKEYLPGELALREGDATVHPISNTHSDRFQWGRARFLDEARMLAGFDHPGIVRVLAFFEANNTAYMVMRYEAGQSLQKVLNHGTTLDEDQLLGLLNTLLDGLDIIHGRNIIHRDIKPENVFIRENSTPVLLDFGSARYALGATEQQTLTMLVSPGYAPIEQYSSDKQTQGPWTDIYGLAATLYRAVSDRPPADAMQRSIKLHHGEPDPLAPLAATTGSGHSPAFLQAIDAGLAFKADQRPQNISAWRAQFSGLADHGAGPGIILPDEEAVTERAATHGGEAAATSTGRARIPPPPRRQRAALIAALLATMLAVIAGSTWWWADRQATGPTAQQLPMLRDPLGGGRYAPVMVVVPPGQYQMGSAATETDREADEGPRQTSTIAASLAVSRSEITVEQFRHFVEDSGYITEVEQTGGCYHRTDVWKQYSGLNWSNPGYSQQDDEPVVCMSRRDAKAYAIWLTTATGRQYRLPSEAEWEYFTRAGSNTARFWGNASDTACNYANVADQRTASLIPNMTAHACRDDAIFTAAVRSYQPNDFGLYDTLGNVWEYTSDCWSERLNGNCSGSGPAMRGGSWSSPPKYLRSANRTEDTRGNRSDFGFRVVAEVELGNFSEE